jgi:hypothetical protein
MTNALYRHLAGNNEYMRQDGGGPVYFKIAKSPSDGNWYPIFTYDGQNWMQFMPAVPFTDMPTAQAALDAYIVQLNAGTA